MEDGKLTELANGTEQQRAATVGILDAIRFCGWTLKAAASGG
jgi:hypothetical protein